MLVSRGLNARPEPAMESRQPGRSDFQSMSTRFQANAAPSHPGSPSAYPAPALVAHSQGGLTLGPGGGVELAAVFCSLGSDFVF
jgi:hypothetical protein